MTVIIFPGGGENHYFPLRGIALGLNDYALFFDADHMYISRCSWVLKAFEGAEVPAVLCKGLKNYYK
ncbi:hypothetical protein CI610_03376 [invertebrate metagenome]|uniref:Uncharacterized protein n=1 Tax=invertebrate metagenome TaxID=1711999 RepID=A0A2H9T386_9ZZZZ